MKPVTMMIIIVLIAIIVLTYALWKDTNWSDKYKQVYGRGFLFFAILFSVSIVALFGSALGFIAGNENAKEYYEQELKKYPITDKYRLISTDSVWIKVKQP